MNKSLLWMTGLAAAMSFNSCDKADDPKKNEEGELITKVHLHLDTINGTDTSMAAHAEYLDLTPDDPAGADIDTLILEKNREYLGKIELADHSKSPEVDITEEIEEEKDDHLFLYQQDALMGDKFSVTITDTDTKGKPLGLRFRLNTKGLTGDTRLRVALFHLPGTKTGNEVSGDADLDVWFPVKIR